MMENHMENDDLQKLEQARQLIIQKEYEQARHILNTMLDNARAMDMLKMLDIADIDTPTGIYAEMPDIKELGAYRLHKILGEGGMGTIYESYQGSMNRKVAIKVLPPQLAKDPEYIQRFTTEIELATKLEHIHILPIYDYGVEGNISYIVMRYLGGGDLEQRIFKRGYIPLDEGLKIIQQIGSALDYAHSRNIIHRDLKASNIMFSEEGNAFLMDFGIAKAIGVAGITQEGYVMGTPHYMPPEQWKGSDIDKRADVYALAILSYFILTGQLPFDGENQLNVMYKHFNETPLPIQKIQPSLPRALNTIIDKGLAKDFNKRYGSAKAFVNDLLEATGKQDPIKGIAKSTLEIPADKPRILHQRTLHSQLKQHHQSP